MAATTNQGDKRRPGRTAPRTKQRKPLDNASVERIVEVIRAWPSLPLTQDLLVLDIGRRGIGTWTRQTLLTRERITDAMTQRKQALASGKKRTSRDPEVVILRRQVDDLKGLLADAVEKLAGYEERFAIMLRNASVRGITQGELERPLHPLDRKAI